MALDADLLDDIRQWTGSEPADDLLETAYRRAGTAEGAALRVLRRMLADATSSGASFSIPGYYSETNTDTLRSLRSAIAALEASVNGGAAGVTTGRLKRRFAR